MLVDRGAFQTKLDFAAERQILQRQQVLFLFCDKI
jgi:hypothetical protein